MTGKKCQVCGAENGQSDFFCRNCGSEIALTPTPVPPPATVGAAPTGKGGVCPKCGQPIEAALPLCTGCGFDLAATGESAAGGGRLLLVIGPETFECKDGDVLGREGTVARSYFGAIGTVSRKHVTITRREGRWFLTASVGVQNITQLDGQEIPRDVEQRLSGEHVLKLSTQCEVRLKVT